MKTLFVVLKSVLVIFLLMLCVSSTSAQKKMHVITLKNGNVLQGKIIRQVPGDFLEIETQDKNFWKFDMEDIAEIRFEKRKLPKNYRDTIVQPLKGMSYEIKMGVLAGGKSNEDDAPFSMLVSGNYRFESGISAGGGVGYETLNGGSMPVFGEIKFQAKLNGISPFIYLQSGYSIALENQFGRNFYHNSEDDVNSVGGILINPGIGFNLGNIGDNRFTLNIGYRFQKMKHKWENSYTKDTEYLKEEYNRLSIHLGLIF
eukprot:TRINITY_DN780002_c0_g1_i1.p1 TRINITY_DN780002_c0_g1~~TRINITY_DN780002_c0_g1_i1.p1  ORF type:complete len:258 (+),score=40.53 TRINITY_DN780002_c0_g1_i1:37-810(+)